MKYFLNLAAYGYLLLYAAQSHAQDFSQDWANYNTYLDMAKDVPTEGRVHEFSGAVTSAFNFYSLSLDGQRFPVGINYFSNGIKVDEYASAVGLGWNLSAGGSITKVTRGLDDDGEGGYNVGAVHSTLSIPEQIYAGIRDGEKDYYVFNAFGFSGAFMNVSGSYIPMNGEKIDVTYLASPSPNFIIKDHNGNAYYFTLQETIHTYLQGTHNWVSSVKGNWFLTKVVTALRHEINITYEAKTITGLLTGVNEIDGVSRIFTAGSSCAGKFVHNPLPLKIYNTFESHRVTSISSPTESITFSYETRTDIPGDKALAGVSISRRSASYKSYLLNHSYINGRLMLDNVVDKNTSTQLEMIVLAFNYYTEFNMPLPFSSVSQDIAGYFNDKPAYQKPGTNYNSLLPVSFKPYEAKGADRNIGEEGCVRTLLLKKITNQFGKVQEFSYERNMYGATLGYGARVSKITTYENTQPYKKKHTRYLYENETGTPSGIRTNTLGDMTVYGSHLGCDGLYRKSVSAGFHARVVDYLGVYTKVKVQVYTDPGNVNASSLGYMINEYRMDPTPILHSNGISLWTVARYRWGLLLSSKNYNKNNQIVDEVNNSYKENYFGRTDNFYVHLQTRYGDVTGLALQTYVLITGYMRLTESIHKTYSPTAELLLTEKKTYTYDALNYVSQVDVYRNNVLKESTTFKRPLQYTLSAGSTDKHIRAVQEMNARRIYAPVLETVTWRKDVSPAVVLSASATLYQYDFTRNVILPAVSFTHRSAVPATSFTPLSITNNMVSVSSTYIRASEVLTYDANQFPVETKTEDLVYNSSYFDKEGRLLCAFSNAALSNTAFLGFEPDEIDKIRGGGTSGQVGWSISNGCSSNNSNATPEIGHVFIHNGGYTGNYAFDFSTCTNSELVCSRALDNKKTYVLQFWQKTGKGTSTPDAAVTPKVLKAEQGWELIEYEFTNITSLRISGTGIIDDVRLFPVEASYAYSNYNTLGLKTSECDGSGECIFYEYDEHYRLRTVKDARGDILKRMEYGIQEQQ